MDTLDPMADGMLRISATDLEGLLGDPTGISQPCISTDTRTMLLIPIGIHTMSFY